jgi:methylmalonyl-CoA decarboxylase
MAYIRFFAEDDIGTIVLDRPAARNALCGEMLDALMDALSAFEDAGIRVVVLRAAPDVAVWSAGHDIRELPLDGSDPLAHSDPLERALRAIRKHPCPVIAMVHGSVWGGATDLAMSCDLCLGDQTATFAITPVNLGLPYNASGIQNLINRVGAHFAKEMFFTAEPVDARHARHYGILNHLVDEEELEEATYALAERIASKGPLAVSVIKEQIRILSGANPVAAETFERIEDLRAQVVQSADYREGITAFLEKRAPEFAGE